MSGVLIAEGRAICRDPTKNNCVTKSFMLTPERDPTFGTLMMGKLDDYDKVTTREEKNKFIDDLCKDQNPAYTGERIVCCPDSYKDDYETALFDKEGNERGNMIGPDTLMNIGKIENNIHMLCDADTLAKCDLDQDDLKKEGYETTAGCIKKVCNEAGYVVNFDKKHMCLIDDESDSNPATDCPIACDIQELRADSADQTVLFIGIGVGIFLVIVIIIVAIYFASKKGEDQDSHK
jgi:hypothetical protein